MSKFIVGKKIGMTNIIADSGALLPVTLVYAEPNTVVQKKTAEKDGYSAIQIGFNKTKKTSKPQKGHQKRAKSNHSNFKEFRVDDNTEFNVGDSINVGLFSVGEKVKITGTSKGKGFAGTIKRWNFSRGPKTHGSRNYRKPGSIGSMYPQKVFKGKKMAGRMGGEQTTYRNVEVLLVDPENNVIGLKGQVPGPYKGLVVIKGE